MNTTSEKQKEYLKQYRITNRERIKAKAKEYRDNHKNSTKEYNKKYFKNIDKNKVKENNTKRYSKNKDTILEKAKEYYIENKEQIKERVKLYKRNRRQTDILFRLKTNIIKRTSTAFKTKGYTKRSRTYEILGCSYEEFKSYIEDQFESWMTWNNYGLYNGTEKYGWDVDHIVPLSSAKTEEELYGLSKFTNLQPLCSKVNRDIKKSIR